jgi:HPt (histidine-containing phosphotransfer) domain-containing protein
VAMLGTVVGGFLSDSVGLLQQLVEAKRSGNLTAITTSAHALHGSSRTMFATRMANAAAALEVMDPSLPESAVDALIAELRAAVDECIAFGSRRSK